MWVVFGGWDWQAACILQGRWCAELRTWVSACSTEVICTVTQNCRQRYTFMPVCTHTHTHTIKLGLSVLQDCRPQSPAWDGMIYVLSFLHLFLLLLSPLSFSCRACPYCILTQSLSWHLKFHEKQISIVHAGFDNGYYLVCSL